MEIADLLIKIVVLFVILKMTIRFTSMKDDTEKKRKHLFAHVDGNNENQLEIENIE